MNRTLRTSTALVASLSLALTHLPLASIAQEIAADQCLEGEDEATCLTRLLEAGTAATAATGATEEAAREDEAARLAAEAAAAEAARLAAEAEAQAQAEAEAAANAAAANAAAEAEAEAAADAAAAEALAAEAAAEAAATEAEEAARLAAEIAAAEAEAMARAEAEAAEARAQADAAAATEAATDAEALAAAEAEALRRALEAAATEDATRQQAADVEAVPAEATAETPDVAADDAPPAETVPPVIVDAAPDADAVPENTQAAELADAPADAPASASDAEALAAALAAADAEATADAAPEPTPLVVTEDTISPEDAAALEAAREAAAAAELAAAAPVDPVVEAEAEIAAEQATAEQSLQSMALVPEAAPATDIVTEVITAENARLSTQDFGQILTAEPTAAGTLLAGPSDRGGLSGIEGVILGGVAGIVVGSILSGNRQVVNRADDRVVVLRPQGDYQVLRDDDALMRRPGNAVVTESFADGSSRNVITQPDGTQVITIRDPDLRILRRTVVDPDGRRTLLIDDTQTFAPVQVSQLPARPAPVLSAFGASSDAAALARALQAEGLAADRSFSLAQVRGIRAVRDLAPALNLESVTFPTGSAAITPDQASQLLALGRFMSDTIAANPREIFLVEGHTDATGSAAFNLALSDRRAESVALALTEFFGVPAQNMVIQGYGEDFLLIPTLENERRNRRVAVRRITDLLQVAAAN